jgi:ankyrin repeat protein
MEMLEGGPLQAPNPLYVAVNFSLPYVVTMILAHASPNQESGFLSYPIFVAIAEANAEALAVLLRGGADVNAHMRDGRAPLHYATGKHSLSILRLLVEWKADITAKARGITPLMIALLFRDIPLLSDQGLDATAEVVQLLSNDGTEVNVISEAFVLAIQKSHIDAAKILLDMCPFLLNQQDPDGNTFLHIAVRLGKVKMASFVLDAGADDTIQNRGGLRAIDLAAKAQDALMLRALRKIDFDVEIVSYFLDGIDLAFLLDTVGYEHVVEYMELLMYLSSIDPTEHAWYCHLARACFQLGEYTAAAKLWERSYQVNPQNDQVTSIEGLAQSIECERCHNPIYGRQWICMNCHRQLCESCHKYDRAMYHCRGDSKSHSFIGIPAHSCQLRGESWIEVRGDKQQEVYELLEEPLNPEAYYVRDNQP